MDSIVGDWNLYGSCEINTRRIDNSELSGIPFRLYSPGYHGFLYVERKWNRCFGFRNRLRLPRVFFVRINEYDPTNSSTG